MSACLGKFAIEQVKLCSHALLEGGKVLGVLAEGPGARHRKRDEHNEEEDGEVEDVVNAHHDCGHKHTHSGVRPRHLKHLQEVQYHDDKAKGAQIVLSQELAENLVHCLLQQMGV